MGGLKGRGKDDTRVVPCRPALTRILQEHVKAEGLRPGELLFPGEHGDTREGSVFRRVWRTARKQVPAPAEFASPLGKRVHDLRHTSETSWLSAIVPPAQAAEWAGRGARVLRATYARCSPGRPRDRRRRIEAGGDLSEPDEVRRTGPRNFDTYATEPPARTR
ncbi:hypothetical protein [Streptomyces sp. NPDC026673]|uniref:hypothetical protein n=1 Tax=Streptomyces sp. NPDC026673 TaxID=3155724 RepID=UPI0033D95866